MDCVLLAITLRRCALKDGAVLSDNSILRSCLRDDLTLIFSHSEPKDKPALQALGPPLPEQKPSPKEKTRLIACKSKMESQAYHQLLHTATLDSVNVAIGFPNMHPGRGFLIGCAIITDDVAYPCLVGEDIGCGMSVVRTGIPTTKKKTKKWFKHLKGIEGPADKKLEEYLQKEPFEWPSGTFVPPVKYSGQKFGTLGHGGHFAEIQEVSHVLDDESFEKLGLNQNELYLLVHSGSRSFGEVLYEGCTKTYGTSPITSPEKITAYLQTQDQAISYAKRNRAVVAYRVLEQLGNIEAENWFNCRNSCIIDVSHNFIESCPEGKYIHRRGAVPSNKGIVVIPGSRGSYTYLVKPVDLGEGYSLPNGAGRAMSRAKACKKVKTAFGDSESLLKSGTESYVICENKELLYEQAPMAYKVISMLKNFDRILTQSCKT
eukprot:TRINITY_DN3239_c0_g1_i1.p2 TRINITY_DN3239_c0_g1~~TRINITY_DN3239_c0_g1_i1.p2  ORF type:complete len:432 (+),score=17.40 TRINITY_DN3239_c0_g1_i1:296-1591(+)